MVGGLGKLDALMNPLQLPVYRLRTPAFLVGLVELLSEKLFLGHRIPYLNPGGSDLGELALVTFLSDRIPEECWLREERLVWARGFSNFSLWFELYSFNPVAEKNMSE